MKKAFCMDNPHIHFPPVIIYIILFFVSLILQKAIGLPVYFFKMTAVHAAGWLLVLCGFIVTSVAVAAFIRNKTTYSTMHPVTSLQTTGIYSLSRNPMYLGLLGIYTGMALIKGNWWTILLIPFLLIIMNQYIIRKEEKYLQRRFGEIYQEYKNIIRRWI